MCPNTHIIAHNITWILRSGFSRQERYTVLHISWMGKTQCAPSYLFNDIDTISSLVKADLCHEKTVVDESPL